MKARQAPTLYLESESVSDVFDRIRWVFSKDGRAVGLCKDALLCLLAALGADHALSSDKRRRLVLLKWDGRVAA